jgi:hypothetical protein
MRRHSPRSHEGRKRGRWGKRLRRIAAAVILIPLLAGFYAYINFRDVVVWFANRGHPQLVLGVRNATLHWHRMEFSDLVLTLRDNKEEVVRIDSAVIKFTWRGLREHKIGAVTVKRPRARISDRLLAAVRNDTPAPPANQPAATPWHVKKFAVLDGWAEIDLAATPLIRFWFAPEFHDLELSAGQTAATPQQTVALEGIEFLSRGGKAEQVGKIGRLELKFSQFEAAIVSDHTDGAGGVRRFGPWPRQLRHDRRRRRPFPKSSHRQTAGRKRRTVHQWLRRNCSGRLVEIRI